MVKKTIYVDGASFAFLATASLAQVQMKRTNWSWNEAIAIHFAGLQTSIGTLFMWPIPSSEGDYRSIYQSSFLAMEVSPMESKVQSSLLLKSRKTISSASCIICARSILKEYSIVLILLERTTRKPINLRKGLTTFLWINYMMWTDTTNGRVCKVWLSRWFSFFLGYCLN